MAPLLMPQLFDDRQIEPLRKMGISVEAIGDATAPRSTYEAVYEGRRQARKL
jgi:hypothetical protein